MKYGDPINAVTAPTGNSAGDTMVLAVVSASSKNIAPPKAEKGIRILLLGPNIILTICGTRNPTKPIIPEKETLTAIIIDEIMMISCFNFSVSTPRLLA